MPHGLRTRGAGVDVASCGAERPPALRRLPLEPPRLSHAPPRFGTRGGSAARWGPGLALQPATGSAGPGPFNSRFVEVPDRHACSNSSSIAGLAPLGYAIALNLLSRLGETANIVSRRRNTGGCSGESSMRHQPSHPWVDQEAPRPSAIGPLGDPDQREPATATHRSGPHDQASGSNATAPLGAHSVHLIAIGTSQALDRPHVLGRSRAPFLCPKSAKAALTACRA